jgi:hypothetical protein
MTDATYFLPYDATPAALRLRRRRRTPRVALGSLIATSSLAGILTVLSFGSASGPGNARMPLVAARAIAVTAQVAERAAQALEAVPNPMLAAAFTGPAATFDDNHPVPSRFAWFAPAAPIDAVAEAPAPTPGAVTLQMAAASEPALAGPQVLATIEANNDAIPVPPVAPAASPLVAAAVVPVPMPRPADLIPQDVAPTLNHTPFRPAHRPVTVATAAPAATATADNRSFLEKFFGVGQSSNPALGYAQPEDNFFNRFSGAVTNPARSYGEGTAVYEIASHTVYMPDGTRLEAHSGLGARLDDPRYVGDRMRGPTPPHAYSLTMREKLFHGVQALRLTPVGDGGIFGRNGLLAHTYMLGPNGDSNGCVSFRNYKAFLQAFQNGDVRRLIVVARLS